MGYSLNLSADKRAERKLLITVAEWHIYTLTTSEPANWATTYTSYYTKSGDVYTPVPSATNAPSWASNTYYSAEENREILGKRVENSSIELNPDVQTSTDILGINYTDVNKTQPQQSLDPSFVLGGSALSEYLYNAVIENDIQAYNNFFNIYIISAFMQDASQHYKAVMHSGCSIIPSSIGGDAYVAMPIDVHLSNNITTGYVNKLTDDFSFTADVTV